MQLTNRDNDSPSRLLARYIKTVTDQYVDQLEVNLVIEMIVFTWWRSYSLVKMGLPLFVL
jgi:hypothetical protein